MEQFLNHSTGSQGPTSTQTGVGAHVGALVTPPGPTLPKARARANSTPAASVASALVQASPKGRAKHRGTFLYVPHAGGFCHVYLAQDARCKRATLSLTYRLDLG